MRGRRLGRTFWSLIMVTGIGLSVMQMGPIVTLFALALMCSCATVVLLVLHDGRSPHEPASPRPWLRDSAALGVKIGAGVVAAANIIDASAPVALLLAVMAAVATVPVLLRRRRRRPAERTARQTPTAAEGRGSDPDAVASSDDMITVVAALTTPQLCAMWRSTFWELRMPHTGDEQLNLVSLRQRCLDELDRRDPSALRAWLASGARASGGPERYLKPPHHHGSADAA